MRDTDVIDVPFKVIDPPKVKQSPRDEDLTPYEKRQRFIASADRFADLFAAIVVAIGARYAFYWLHHHPEWVAQHFH